MFRLVAVPILLLAVAGCTPMVPPTVPIVSPTVAPMFQPTAAPTLQPSGVPLDQLPASAPLQPTPAPAASGLQPGPDVLPQAVAPLAQPAPVVGESRVFLPGTNHECVWETVVDVVDDYFEIEREEPVRVLGSVITEGRLNTRPEVSATLFEPWRRDSLGWFQRLESTLQSIRRFAQVRVQPGDGGFWVEVAVFKELEDVAQPEFATAGAATFRNDSSFVRVETPVGPQLVHCGWIPLGRDLVLEQEIIAQLQLRYGTTPLPVATPGL